MSELESARNGQPDETGELSPAERDRLSELEEVIERGKQTFVEVGEALFTIRSERLYRPLTWEAYCEQRWSFTSRRAHQLIEGAKIGNRFPIVPSDTHARALSRLPEHLQEQVAPLIENLTTREAERVVREVREKHGIGNLFNHHPRLIALSTELGGLEGRWKEEMCKELTPPEARKQLRQIEKAMAVLEKARAAVEYRATTMHTWAGR